MNKLFRLALEAIADYIRKEKNHPVGRVNLAAGVLLLFLALLGLIPSVVDKTLDLVRFIKEGKSPSEWTSSIPLISFVILTLYFAWCLKLLPPKPPL